MAPKRLSKSKWKKLVAAALATATISGTGYFVLNQKNKNQTVPAYTVARVIDGDTFETTEKQLVRLANLLAPELEYCGGPEAKVQLEKLILGKPVYFKALFRDQYHRLDSLVYTPDGFVNEQMILVGAASFRLSGKSSPESDKIQRASDQAKEELIGIHSEKCTQSKNKQNSKCVIKGNVRDQKKFYHYPGCAQYNNTTVQLYLGDQWFCTEAEAQKKGFIKADLCP